MPGNDDRRPRNGGASEALAGAPGWRVTPRAAAPATRPAAAPAVPRMTAPGAATRSEAPAPTPAPSATLARSPRRVAAAGRRGRGISLLALAAAAVVVVFVLGLAALDAQRRDLSAAWGERAVSPPGGTALMDPPQPAGGPGDAEPGSLR